MRERTTWSREAIAKKAFGRTAEDPRAMNQDHLQQQPAADAYDIGGPSDFAEGVHPSAGTWKAEQSGGETKRNEIGMPEMRGDTFNHAEKTASEEELLKKADLCGKIARTILKNASDMVLEDQALALMSLPDAALVQMANRLANQDQDQGQDQGQDDKGKQANDDDKEQAQGQDDQGKQANADQDQGQEQQAQGQDKEAGQVPPQFKENIEKMKDKAKDKDDDGDKGQNKEATAGDQFLAAMKQGNGQGIQQALSAMMAGALQQALAQQPQNQQQMAQQQQVQQQMAQGQNQQQMAQNQEQQQMAQQPQQQLAEDELLDQLLQQDLGQPGQMMAAGAEPTVAGMDHEIEMEANTMDVGEIQLGAEDAVLTTLFASNDEYRNAAEATHIQGGDHAPAAGMPRTASARTVGTHPTAGVPRIGGAVGSTSGAKDVDRLSGLWQSAPNVKDVFR